jgi:hypothetical protein
MLANIAQKVIIIRDTKSCEIRRDQPTPPFARLLTQIQSTAWTRRHGRSQCSTRRRHSRHATFDASESCLSRQGQVELAAAHQVPSWDSALPIGWQSLVPTAGGPAGELPRRLTHKTHTTFGGEARAVAPVNTFANDVEALQSALAHKIPPVDS